MTTIGFDYLLDGWHYGVTIACYGFSSSKLPLGFMTVGSKSKMMLIVVNIGHRFSLIYLNFFAFMVVFTRKSGLSTSIDSPPQVFRLNSAPSLHLQRPLSQHESQCFLSMSPASEKSGISLRTRIMMPGTRVVNEGLRSEGAGNAK